jgi:hypothetical protein
MMYRYGDATPFPFEDNFIDTLVAVVDAAVELFRADVKAETGRAKAMSIRQQAETELQRLAVLEKAIETAIAPHLPEGKGSNPAEVSAKRIAAAAHNQIKHTKATVLKRRESGCRLALGDQPGLMAFDAISVFLLNHQLPKTQWTIRWSVDTLGHGHATVEALAPCDLAASFKVAIPDSDRWATPVRVASLEPELTLELQEKSGWLRKKTRLCKQSLHKLFITEIEVSPSRDALVLRKSIKKPSEGYRVVLRDEEHGMPTIVRIEADGSAKGQPLALTGDSAVSLSHLWSQIDTGMHQLLRHRSTVAAARFENTSVDRLSDPADLAEALLNCIAPVVREMRKRSRVPGELIIKRDLGDGRREELFVPRKELEAKFASLPLKHRNYFEAIGLSGEATCEFVSREFPLSPPDGMRAANPNAKTLAPPRPPAVSSKPPPMPPMPTIEAAIESLTDEAEEIDDDSDDDSLPMRPMPGIRIRPARVGTEDVTREAGVIG